MSCQAVLVSLQVSHPLAHAVQGASKRQSSINLPTLEARYGKLEEHNQSRLACDLLEPNRPRTQFQTLIPRSPTRTIQMATPSTCRALRALGRQWQTVVQPLSLPTSQSVMRRTSHGCGLSSYLYWAIVREWAGGHMGFERLATRTDLGDPLEHLPDTVHIP